MPSARKSDDLRNRAAGSSELSGMEAAAEPPSDTPEHWMRRYQDADAEAPSVLVAMLSPALLRFFRYNAASREQAEDLLQETWLRVHRMRHSYRSGERLLPWVYAIAHHVRIDSYRRKRRLAEREMAFDPLPDAGAPDASVEALEFQSMLAVLPDAQREVVTMLKATGMTVDEVARATCSTVGAVKLKAHRAYERLRELLTEGSR
jgi:RNA polymerase sigma-70 factor (ECF subfamily)